MTGAKNIRNIGGTNVGSVLVSNISGVKDCIHRLCQGHVSSGYANGVTLIFWITANKFTRSYDDSVHLLNPLIQSCILHPLEHSSSELP